ncbi:SAC3 family protein A-like [Pistacia vera]|uniref:SAC3 family protein A-like n=1 Tax=Pistacia vera TaxID=55513 RepID=UPI001262EBA4|nr:SAC3 family protein A-like [Pistacia vera]
MMNQGGNTQTVASLDPNLVENRYVVDASQSQTSYLPSTTSSGAVSWNTHCVDNRSIENGILPNSTYHHEQHTEPLVRNVQDGVNSTSVASSSSLGAIVVSQDYSGYTPYPNSSDPYSYGNTGSPGYYSNYQQQPNDKKLCWQWNE